jgi:hypothetical protein
MIFVIMYIPNPDRPRGLTKEYVNQKKSELMKEKRACENNAEVLWHDLVNVKNR